MIKPFDRIPRDLRGNKEIAADQKLILAYIVSISHRDGFASASNKHFSEIFGVSKRTMTNYISKLESAGFIKIETYTNELYYTERKIKLTGKTKLFYDLDD